MATTRGSVARATALRTIVVVGVSGGVVLLGGSAVWLLERNVPGHTWGSWGDGLCWALTTITTTGYGDHVPVTLAGRLVGAVVMMTGVAIVGGVAAGVALVVVRAAAHAEEQALVGEAASLEEIADDLAVSINTVRATSGPSTTSSAPAPGARPFSPRTSRAFCGDPARTGAGTAGWSLCSTTARFRWCLSTRL